MPATRWRKSFPILRASIFRPLVTSDQVDWSKIDVVFGGLPHGTAHGEIAKLPRACQSHRHVGGLPIARSRTSTPNGMAAAHRAPTLMKDAVYGLTEHYRDKIRNARIVACPGCYPTAVLLALLPLVKAKLIQADDIIIDAKSGVSGAGRTLEAEHPVLRNGRGALALRHRQSSPCAGNRAGAWARRTRAVTVNFTPHLAPMSRGELCTCYVPCRQGDG